MSENGTNLSTKQRKVIEALIVSATTDEAALVAGVGRTTIYRWRNESPEFAAALRDAQAAAMDAFTTDLLAMSASAAAAIRDALASDDLNIRLRAANIYLARLLEFRELHDLEQRIQALESKTP
jgi:hypothetical protein